MSNQSDQTVAELESRIEKLEEEQQELVAEQDQVLSLFEQFKHGQISRRAFLTSVAAVGGVGLMAANASADGDWANASGYSGTQSNPLNEVWAATGEFQDVNADGTVNTRQLGSERLFAGSFDGGGADARLDAAITEASDGDVVFLENASYSADRTISTSLSIAGTAVFANRTTGSYLDGAVWTLDTRVDVTDLNMSSNTSNEIILNDRGTVQNLSATTDATITVSADGVLLSNLRAVSVVFESGTSGGRVDSSVALNVTDNGTNSVGDVS